MGGWLLGPDNRLAILSLGNVLEWMADARSLGQKLSNLMRDCVVNYYHYLFFHVIVISLITSTQLFQLPVGSTFSNGPVTIHPYTACLLTCVTNGASFLRYHRAHQYQHHHHHQASDFTVAGWLCETGNLLCRLRNGLEEWFRLRVEQDLMADRY